MAYFPNTSVGLTPGTMNDQLNLDAFQRLRTAEPLTQFEMQSLYSVDPWRMEGLAVGTGGVANVANQCAVRLTTGGTATNAAYTLQSKACFLYQPGKSRFVAMTFVMGTARTNSTTEIGYGDAQNGIFLQRVGSTVQLTRRTYTGGSAQDNAVVQADWNIDKLNGSGASGLTLNLAKAQILIIDLQFLGVGRVRVGFDIDGEVVWAHQFLNANNLTTVYMSSGSLPIRYRVVNNDTADDILTLDAICASVISEGGYESNTGRALSKSNDITAISTSSTEVGILAIRPATTWNSVTWRGHIYPIWLDLLVASQNHIWKVYRGATITGGSWAAVNAANSAAEANVTLTGFSGGIEIASGYVAASASTRASEGFTGFSQNPLVYTSLNNVQETLLITARTLTGTGTALAAVGWTEQY